MGSLVRLENISKSFPAPQTGQAPTVLRDVELKIAEGDSLAILGPSGSGKSTLLNIIGTLEPPTSGRVLFEGRDVGLLAPDALADFRNREIGFVFQHHHLLPQCTALENVLVPTLAGARKGEDRQAFEARARELLDTVGLGTRLGHRPAQLSGGERQRVAAVRALINRPRLLLADEPTGSLDQAAADALSELLLQLNREQGVALILVTHARRLGERMQRVLELKDGVPVERAPAQ